MNRVDHDDDPLLAELGAALRARQAVPDRLVALGKSAFEFRDTVAELAALTSDSTASAGTRAERATLRSLTFVAGDVAIELELRPDALVGQVVPPRPGRLDVLTPTGPLTTVTVDDLGWFSIHPAPTGPTRLHLRTADGLAISTEWTVF